MKWLKKFKYLMQREEIEKLKEREHKSQLKRLKIISTALGNLDMDIKQTYNYYKTGKPVYYIKVDTKKLSEWLENIYTAQFRIGLLNNYHRKGLRESEGK